MNSASGQPPHDGAPLRVVLVGRTAAHGVDAALRRDRDIEVIRARTPMAALGELADPIDDASPREVAVVVAPDAIAPDRTKAFAAAVRRVSEHARLLGLNGSVPTGFDGTLPTRDAEAMRRQVRGVSPGSVHPRAESPVPAVPVLPVARVASPVAHASAPAPNVFGGSPDPAPVAALATGRDPLAVVLASIRRRLGLAEARFAAGASADEAATSAASVPVVFGSRTLGRLVFTVDPGSPQPSLDALAREADHLGAWVALSAQQDQLRRAAFTDELSGAFNRRYFNRFLGAAIEQATGARHTVTLLVFDVDNFKTYNDRFGHAAGDEILVELVRLLNAGIRTTDRVCRIGGDEFAVIFHDPEGPRGPAGAPTSPRSIGDIVRRFQKQICEHRFPKLSDMAAGTLTLSGGMATFPWDGRTVQQLLDRADELALQAKRQGKNHITMGPGAEQVCRAE